MNMDKRRREDSVERGLGEDREKDARGNGNRIGVETC